eukprot:Lankesteria_metandrocarpae@DN4970_c0_g1_i2.p1
MPIQQRATIGGQMAVNQHHHNIAAAAQQHHQRMHQSMHRGHHHHPHNPFPNHHNGAGAAGGMMMPFADPFSQIEAMQRSMFGGQNMLMPQMMIPPDPFQPPALFGGDMSMAAYGGFGGGTGSTSMMSSSSAGGANGPMRSQMMVMSSTVGSDGSEKIQKFERSSHADPRHKMCEVQSMYSDNTTGDEVRAMERYLGERSRQRVEKRNLRCDDHQSHEAWRGLESDQDAEAFNVDWHERRRRAALPHNGNHETLMRPQLTNNAHTSSSATGRTHHQHPRN